MVDLENPFVRELLALADEAHGEAHYGDLPYSAHYLTVTNLYHEAKLADADRVGILHDSIEDILAERRTEFTVRVRALVEDKAFNIIWAMSGFGHNRKTRVADWRAKVTALPEALPYKTGDRIINLEFSKQNNPGLFKMYMREDSDFFWEEIASRSGNAHLIDRYRAVSGR